nr:hypothetical protein [Nanoarchaeum sp.]
MVEINPQKLEEFLGTANGYIQNRVSGPYTVEIQIDLKPGISLILSKNDMDDIIYSAILKQDHYPINTLGEMFPLQGHRTIPLNFDELTLEKLYELADLRLRVLRQERKTVIQTIQTKKREELENMLDRQLDEFV